jgi:hypothetical protein
VATQMNGNQMGGVIPIQIPQGGQPGAYGVQMPVAGQWQPQVQPTGQQVLNGNAGASYGIEHLPPAPQPQGQGQQPFMGPQGNFGLTPQWGAQGQQQGFQPQQFGDPQLQPRQFVTGMQHQPQQQAPGWQQPAQPFGQPTQGQFQQQPQQQGVPQLGLNTRLDGPGVPNALRGRTLGEALTLYSAMEGTWAQRQGITQTPAQQSLAQMQSQQGAAVQGQQAQQQPGAQGQQQANPWTNPGQFFGDLFEQKLEQRLGPVIQHTQQQAVSQAYTIAKGGVVDFAALEPDLMQMLAGADPQSLANPATWIGAADIVRGRQMREGRYQPPNPQQMGVQQVQIPGQQPSWQQRQNPAQMPGQPAGQQFGQVPNYGFFTEAPTAPSVSQFGGAVVGQPAQQDYEMATKFGMPIQEWMAWKVGVSGQQGSSGQSHFSLGGAR